MLKNARTGERKTLQAKGSEVRDLMPWLKRENARGSDVFIRPVGEHGVVFLQGLSSSNVERLKRNGYSPAVTIESATGSFDAVVRLSNSPLPDQVRQLAEIGLSRSSGADLREAGTKAFTRLAGFTEQSSTHEQKPYVLAHQGSVGTAPSAAAALKQTQAFIEAKKSPYQAGKDNKYEVAKSPERRSDRGFSR